jgi:hypothetical protein
VIPGVVHCEQCGVAITDRRSSIVVGKGLHHVDHVAEIMVTYQRWEPRADMWDAIQFLCSRECAAKDVNREFRISSMVQQVLLHQVAAGNHVAIGEKNQVGSGISDPEIASRCGTFVALPDASGFRCPRK